MKNSDKKLLREAAVLDRAMRPTYTPFIKLFEEIKSHLAENVTGIFAAKEARRGKGEAAGLIIACETSKKFEGRNEYVTWFYNSEKNYGAMGHYFLDKAEALHDFNKRS